MTHQHFGCRHIPLCHCRVLLPIPQCQWKDCYGLQHIFSVKETQCMKKKRLMVQIERRHIVTILNKGKHSIAWEGLSVGVVTWDDCILLTENIAGCSHCLVSILCSLSQCHLYFFLFLTTTHVNTLFSCLYISFTSFTHCWLFLVHCKSVNVTCSKVGTFQLQI